MLKKMTIMIFSAALIVGLAACGSANKQGAGTNQGTAPGQTTPPAATVDAAAVYKQNCLVCHGANLEGQVGPNLQKVGATRTPEEISTVIHNGGNGMTAFKGVLSEDEISALVDWLSAHK
ncbi:c-type cytochrome [Paenibacillus thiaminolyticus]|uniref:c-type cytochrome n=1 Tax=Paenibacillus thiaminolyticus TaxID=49283 RepID=UPI0025433AF0|nr:cytochrome c [Paenibacillus thiaminolyticus]WII36956.1 cytochrome c [Paenibacillus thiaminolyticus]